MAGTPRNSASDVDGVAGVIPNAHYHDPRLLHIEGERIFGGGWQFVGLSDELARHRDFVCVDLPGESIVTQNFHGELRAFRNVCSHRLNLIQTVERGNRALTCRYHGWTFDSEGMPLGRTRKQNDFLVTGERPERLCLVRYRVEICGRFVFVARDPEAPSLQAFLGKAEPLLRALSGHIGAEIYFGCIPHHANWKLLVENVLECYHCETVHPESFVRGLGVGRIPITNVEIFEADVGIVHSSSHFPRTPTNREALRRRIVAHLDGRGFAHDSFFHVHIFPNLFISSTQGTSFYIGQALPQSPDWTTLRIRFFEPAIKLNEGGRRRQDALNHGSIPLGLKVIEEDRAILETVQRGIAIARQMAVFGQEEVRLTAFNEGYLRAMEE